ncbi:MAG TPA: LysR substrate-binding domain-containing protein [Chthoniobacterales bacterium]|jgi:LysR family cyn operon transcriptional activator
MNEPLEIRHLRYFLAVAEAGSFSRAADRLGISQPSVSQQMRDLEADLRVSLFQRRGKRILLTPTGLIFQEHARTILRQLENLQQELTSEPDQLRGSLHIGVVPILNVPLMPHLLGLFAKDHPGLSLIVEEISSTEIETALEEGRMDVGLGFVTRHSPNLNYERLCTDEFSLIVSDDHAWSGRSKVPVAELHQERLLQLPATFVMRRMTDEICRKHRVRPRTVAEINSIETLLQSLRILDAGALMPNIVLRGRDRARLKAIQLEGNDLTLEIGLLRLIDAEVNSAMGAFTRLAQIEVPKMIERSGS